MENTPGINSEMIIELESKESLTDEEQKELDYQRKLIEEMTEARLNPEVGDMHQY